MHFFFLTWICIILKAFCLWASAYKLSIYYLYACLLSHQWGSGAMASDLDTDSHQSEVAVPACFPWPGPWCCPCGGPHPSLLPGPSYRTAGEEGGRDLEKPREARQLATGWDLFGVLLTCVLGCWLESSGEMFQDKPHKNPQSETVAREIGPPAFQPCRGLAWFFPR